MAAFVYPGIVGLVLLAQAGAPGGGSAPGGVSIEGTQVTARDSDGRAFFMSGADPTTDQWEPALGTVQVTAEDRVQSPSATWGDGATVHAEVRSGGDTWTVELTRPGFPVGPDGSVSAARGWVQFPISGGVLTDAQLQGFSGVGFLRGPLVQAAAAIWGQGTVRRNGQIVTDEAVVEVDALSAGGHADDQSFRTLRTARAGDAEVVVFAANLPTARVPTGFVLFGFEDVRISAGGRLVASQLTVPSTGAEGAATVETPTGPTFAPSPVVGVGGAGSAGTPTTGTTNGTFSSPGIPASPSVLNNGTGVTALPSTPQPLNATPAQALPQTPAPANAAPATTALPASPAPANATPGATTPGGVPTTPGATPTTVPGTPGPAPATPGT